MLAELAEIAQERSSAKRVTLLHRITDLYIGGLEDHSAAEELLFDEIMTRILDDIPREAKAHAAVHLSALPSAPHGTIIKLARDGDIEVARPVLRGSAALSDDDLVAVARVSSQAHLHAIATRERLSEPITDVLVERGDREVALTLSGNHGACLSESGLSALIDKADGDADLQELLVERPDLSSDAAAKLMPMISQKLAARLAERGHHPQQPVSPELLGVISRRFQRALSGRDRETRNVTKWIDDVRAGRRRLADAVFALVGDENLLGVASLVSAFTALGRSQVFKIIVHGELQPALVLFRSLGLPWRTVDAVLALRAKKRRTPYVSRGLDRDYEAIAEPLAQRVIRFLRVRQSLLKPQPSDPACAAC